MSARQVACLTLFALGSSAPEILIACVGVLPDFKEDALGPGTIVGSATFNLYVIMGLCMLAVEPGDAGEKLRGLSNADLIDAHLHQHSSRDHT